MLVYFPKRSFYHDKVTSLRGGLRRMQVEGLVILQLSMLPCVKSWDSTQPYLIDLQINIMNSLYYGHLQYLCSLAEVNLSPFLTENIHSQVREPFVHTLWIVNARHQQAICFGLTLPPSLIPQFPPSRTTDINWWLVVWTKNSRWLRLSLASHSTPLSLRRFHMSNFCTVEVYWVRESLLSQFTSPSKSECRLWLDSVITLMCLVKFC